MFGFNAAPGMEFRVVAERVDTGLSPFHPDIVDPELRIYDPDGLNDAAHGRAGDRSADDTDAELAAFVTAKAGVYTTCSRTTSGSTSSWRAR